MASLFPDFEYDIFISYRQNDNKYDGWVTEFVANLNKELEATIKDKISVYFDENPHDGLLETHSVDRSLETKLKCLIFIPILSKTYCDSKSYAWNNEFLPFLKITEGDCFGHNIKLNRGNVASRILPVRIHDLDSEDLELVENYLGIIRSVDFIYHSQGVNRPLRQRDDDVIQNTKQPIYRDQINKVANAIHEILRSLKSANPSQVTGDKQDDIQKGEIKIESVRKGLASTSVFRQKPEKREIILLILLLSVIGLFAVFKIMNNASTKKTITVSSIRNLSNDSTLLWYCEGFKEDLLAKLQKVKSFTVIPTYSPMLSGNREQFFGQNRNRPKINYLVEGSIKNEGNNLMIWVRLIHRKDARQLWAKDYPLIEKKQFLAVLTDIARGIANELDAALSPEEIKQIKNVPTTSPDAYPYYLSGNQLSNNAQLYLNMGDKLVNTNGFVSAIGMYDEAIKYDPDFALAYARRAIAISWGYYTEHLDSGYIENCLRDIEKAQKIDNTLTEVQVARGFYYYYCKRDYQKALIYFTRAAIQDPENYHPLYYMALVYRVTGEWEESLNLIRRVIRFNPQEALFLTNIGLSYAYIHNFDSALIYHNKAIAIMPGWFAPYYNKIEVLILKNGNTKEARKALDDAIQKTGESFQELKIIIELYDRKLREALLETENPVQGGFRTPGNKYLYCAKINNLLNKPEIAGIYYDSALVSLKDDLEKDNRNAMIHGLFAIANAGKGNKEKAIGESIIAVDLSIKDKMDESDMKLNQAQVYTMVGEYEKAIRVIEFLLDNPSCFSLELLQLDPVWEPLKNMPEYQSLVRKYSRK